jgi:mono/diheme cytochrome c family protein
MPRIIRWLGVPAALALAIALGTVSGPAAAQQASSSDGQQNQFVGSELFRTYCVACHGKAGLGDGVLGDLMKKRPPDLTQFSRRNGGVFPSELVAKIIDGATRSRPPAAGPARRRSRRVSRRWCATSSRFK